MMMISGKSLRAAYRYIDLIFIVGTFTPNQAALSAIEKNTCTIDLCGI